ncbi:MAG: DEAD/DEAH box helicase [Breznakia sp.]
MTFENLIKEVKLQRAISSLGYTEPTEIQAKAIPAILYGKDVVAKSKTGTGKTAAFGLPLIQQLLNKQVQQAMVLCPTRELALQVHDELIKFAKYCNDIKITCVFGGTPIDRQIRSLKKGVQIIVGTPGRIQDHIRRRTLRMEKINYVVLDEADEMLNIGFRDDIENILSKIKVTHQTVLFSATMPKAIREIASTYLSNKEEIEVQSNTKTVSNIEQSFISITKKHNKSDVVEILLRAKHPNLSIVFCNTKAKVDELVDFLHKHGHNAMALHGDVRQEKRTKIMNRFKTAQRAILVASDVAARGIDVNNIDIVINYDLPQDNEVYVHRIGRTGRAGNKGISISLIQGKKQEHQLRQLMRFTKANIKEMKVPNKTDLGAVDKDHLLNKIETKIKQEGIMFANIQAVNELVKKGYDPQEILSALFSISNNGPLQPNVSSTKTCKKIKHATQLRFTIGSAKKITIHDIEDAIKRDCRMDANSIGKIDIRKQYTIIEVHKEDAEIILRQMNPSFIKKYPFDVYYYKKQKEKAKEGRRNK